MSTAQFYALSSGFATLIILACVILVIWHNRTFSIRGINEYVLLLSSFALGNLCYIIDCLSMELEVKTAMFKLQYILIVFSIYYYIRFFKMNLPAEEDSGNKQYFSLIACIIVSFLIWINPASCFFLSAYLAEGAPGSMVLKVSFNAPFIIVLSTIYVFYMLYIVRVVIAWLRGKVLGAHALSIFISVFILILANTIYLLNIVIYDLTNILDAASACILTHCILNYGVLDAIPYVKRNILTLFRDPFFVLSAKGKVEFANQAAESTLEMPLAQMQGRSLHEINDRFPQNSDAEDEEVTLDSADQQVFKLSITPLVGDRGKKFGQMLILHNITEHKKADSRLRYLTAFDEATGLLNGESFAKAMEKFRHENENGLAETYVFAVAVDNAVHLKGLVTIEQKRNLNSAIARYIAELIPDRFIICKYEENEYYLFSNGEKIVESDFYDLFHRTSHKIFEIGGQTFSTDFKMGAFYITDTTLKAKDAIANASYALSDVLSKNSRIEVYGFNLAKQHDLHKNLINSLKSLNYQKDFYLEFQPIVDIIKQKVVGAEALLRWDHPIHGGISPAVFIPVLEKANEMSALGNAVIQKACDALISWKGETDADFKLSINISKKQIDDPELQQKIKQILKEKKVDPRLLDFEITETATSSSIKNVIDFSRFIREMGASVSIDDFGSGDTSISYITELSPNKVKFDISLSENSHENFERGVVVKSLLDMCNGLKIAVVVEHVESVKALNRLKEQGFALIQGYIFSRAVDERKFLEYYKKFNGN